MDRHEEIKNAYGSLGGEATFYDGAGKETGAKTRNQKCQLYARDVGKLPFADDCFDLVLH